MARGISPPGHPQNWVDLFYELTPEGKVINDTEVPRLWVDQPGHAEEVSGTFSPFGWATDDGRVDRVQVRLLDADGQLVDSLWYSQLIYGFERPDVCQVHSDLQDPNCPRVGWLKQSIDTTNYPNGTYILEVTVWDHLDRSVVFKRTFVIDNLVPRRLGT